MFILGETLDFEQDMDCFVTEIIEDEDVVIWVRGIVAEALLHRAEQILDVLNK